MSIVGAPNDWAGLIDDQTPKLLKLVLAAWKTIPAGAPDEREDEITARLCLALQKCRTARKLMFYIHPQIVELDASTGDEFGRMDIGFFPTNQPWIPKENIYFCLECKRLNVVKNGKKRPYSSEYVTMGITRFVSGQYARSVRHGGMIGYVRDGDVNGAIASVEANIQSRFKSLAMNAPGGFIANGFFPSNSCARETRHRRIQDNDIFRVHHLFLCDGANANN